MKTLTCLCVVVTLTAGCSTDGVVISTRPVVVEGSQSGLGAAAGGVVGGVSGSTVGGGRGAIAGGTVGAVAGGVAGNLLKPGDAVILITEGGRARVIGAPRG